MNESISRAAGASHGQEMPPEPMEAAIRAAGRTPRQRTTLYGTPAPERTRASFGAAALAEPVNPKVDTSPMKRPGRARPSRPRCFVSAPPAGVRPPTRRSAALEGSRRCI